MLQQVDRSQVTHRRFGLAGVQGNFGTKVTGVHHAHMLLRRADIAGVLECDPRVTRLKQHGQHLAPQVSGLNRAGRFYLSACCLFFIGQIGLFKCGAKLVVQVWHVVGRKQRPLAFLHHPSHEQVWNPVGGVHVVGAPAVVTGVLAQFEELFNIQMPGFKVGANSTLALATLIHRHSRVIDHFQERHHPLRLPVCSFDVTTQRAHWRPVVAQAASKLR